MNRFFASCILILALAFPAGAIAQQSLPETKPEAPQPEQEPEPAQAAAPLPRYEETIVVTATRTERPQKDVPVHTEIIDRRTIAATGARSVADALLQQLGIDVTPTVAGEGVQLQGIDARGVLILVDGQEVIGKVGGGVDIANLLVDDIERVEVVKGAASALYGSEALAGAINILTRRVTSPFALSMEQRFESLGGRTTFASIGGRTGGWSGLFSGSRVTREAYDLEPRDPSTTGSAYTKLGLTGKTGFCLSGCLRKPPLVVFTGAAPAVSEKFARVPASIRH